MKKVLSSLLLSSAIAASGLAFSTSEAFAGGMTGQTCDTNNFDPAASMCEGSFYGNDDVNSFADSINGIFGLDGGIDWAYDAKINVGQEGVEGPNTLDFGASVIYNSSTGGSKGSWSFGEAYEGPFAIVLKAANYYSAYYFEAGTNITQGFWDTIGVAANQKNTAAALSHISLYLGSTDDGGEASVPEPATLLGLSVIGGGLVLRRRRSV